MRQLDSCDFCGDSPEGVFEPVPASAADGPVRLALCGDCRTTLRAVVDPLLDAESGAASGARRREPVAAEGEGTAESADEERPGGEQSDHGQSDHGQSDDHANDDHANDDGTGSRDDGGESRDGGAGSGDEEEDTVEDQTDESPAPRPEGYGQVLRLLQNREGAIPRDDLRALARNAYDLAAEECEAVVDAAVENGDLEDTEDGLRTA